MPGIITSYSMGFPDGWASWDITPGSDVEVTAAAVAERAADGDDAQALVRRGVVSLDTLCREEGGFFAAALWVPDRSTGQTVATVRLELLTGPTDQDASWEDALAKAQAFRGQRGFKVFDRAVQPMTVPAGPAFGELTLVAEKPSGLFSRSAATAPVETRVDISVFPAGCSDMLCLRLLSTETGLLDALVQAGRAIAESLTVTVGPAPA